MKDNKSSIRMSYYKLAHVIDANKVRFIVAGEEQVTSTGIVNAEGPD